jgi:20S proteasome subunit beta 6
MSSAAAAQLMSVTLYYRRFFPYYAFCMIAGLDEQGKGAVYGYDAVGSFKRDEYGAMGSGQNFVMPILDNLIGHKVRVVAGLVDHRQTLK